MELNRDSLKTVFFMFPGWEAKRLVYLFEGFGFIAPKVINQDQGDELYLEVWSESQPMLVYYDETVDILPYQKELNKRFPETKDFVFWICVSSNYSQRFVGQFTFANNHALLLRPIDEKEVDSLMVTLPATQGLRKKKEEFLSVYDSLYLEGKIDDAITLCQSALEDDHLKVIASLKLSEIFWNTDRDLEKLEQMKFMLKGNNLNFYVLSEMVFYLRMFPDKAKNLELLLADFLTMYPCDLQHLTDLFRSTIVTESYPSVITYIPITKEFEDSAKLRKIMTAALFVTAKYYIAKNDLELTKEIFSFFNAVNNRLTIKDELLYYAEGLGGRARIIEALNEEDDKPV